MSSIFQVLNEWRMLIHRKYVFGPAFKAESVAKIGKILDTEGGNGKKVRKEAQFYSLHTEKWTSMPLQELQFKTMNYAFIRSA